MKCSRNDLCHGPVLVASSEPTSRRGPLPSRPSESLARHLIILLALLGLTACDTDPAPDPHGIASARAADPTTEGAADEPSYSYSPFVMHLDHEELPFGAISFKDVGMSLPDDHQVFAYEALAESLSLELQRGVADLSVEVRHTVEILDPAAHVACEGRHIYVDLWKAGSGWGYSLWSGCGEDDEFAHREVASVSEAAADTGDAATFEPLTRDIARSLLAAVESGCFTRHC